MLRRIPDQRGTILTSLGFFWVVIIFMVLIAIPVVRHARAENHAQTCTDNLAALLAAKEHYILNHDLKQGAPTTLNDLRQGTPPLLQSIPLCPDGGTYTLNPVGVLPACSTPGHALPMAAKLKKNPTAAGVAPTTQPAARK